MQVSLASAKTRLAEVSSSEVFRSIRPILLAGAANGLLLFSVDRTQALSLFAGILGLSLLGIILTRQMLRVVSLEKQVGARLDQLEVMSELVAALNSSGNVGSHLGTAMDKLLCVLEADAGAIWLPSTDGDGSLVLVEQRGFPAPDRHPEVLAAIQSALGSTQERLLVHQGHVPSYDGVVNCLTVRMGHVREGLGFLTLVKWAGGFTSTEAAIVAAVGTDIGNALRSVRMISEARKQMDRDPVTGLLNHRTAYQRLYAEIDRHGRVQKPMAVVLMDLDNFKLFNDTYGHPAGDEVLKRVAGSLSRSCREHDVVSRYGGDEFMVILPETNLKAAIKCAERIQAALARERFRCEHSATLSIGFSYGVGVYPEDSQDAMGLVSVADANLYQSRVNGGNQITARSTGRTERSLLNVPGFDLFHAMVTAIDNKDGYTRKHSEEVTEYSLTIARALKLGEDVLRAIEVSGILHDVGKIGVPDAILRKPGKLTDEEFEIMKQHPVFGALIVGSMPGMEHIVLGVRHHHERYDGRGYPDHLAGNKIPLIGRIMALADAFSAMTTTRPYRKGLTERQAIAEIENGLGTQFDPELGALFIRLRSERAEEGTAAVKGTRRKPAKEAALVGAGEAVGSL